jgi:hypothetical protein
LYEITRILLLSAHLLTVNVAAGGPVICLWLEWRKGKRSSDATRYMAAGSLVCLLVGGVLGVALGAMEWDGKYRDVWMNQLWWKVFFAVLEFLFSGILLLAYWLWRKRENPSTWLSIARSFLLFVAATNLLYHFPTLFFNGQRLLDTGSNRGALSNAEFRTMLLTGETPALAVHVALASVAVAGLALAHLALRWERTGRNDDAQWVAISGARWALGATLLQLPVGLWVLVSLPTTMQNELVGSNPLGLVVFASGLVAALWLTRELVTISMGEWQRAGIIRAMLGMLLTITLMTASHDIARQKRQVSRAAETSSATIDVAPRS